MQLPWFIARRYLFSKKSHNVINIISVVSAVALGLGCMALIIILSVYNGFDSIITGLYNNYSPDFIIEPARGKVINLEDQEIRGAYKVLPQEALFIPVIEENVYIQYGNAQTISKIKGVTDDYEKLDKITSHITNGKFALHFGDFNRAVVAEYLAGRIMLKPQFSTPLVLYYPSRTEEISLITPIQSLLSEEILTSGLISLDQSQDQDLIYLPISVVRSLIEYEESQATAVEIFLCEAEAASASAAKTANTLKESNNSYYGKEEALSTHKRLSPRQDKQTRQIERKLRNTLSNKFILKNRWQQNQTIYKMMRSEKFAVYLILFFVIILVSVNIFASLSMLIIDKKQDIQTYKSLGAQEGLLRRSFTLHGWSICMCGAVTGLCIGLILCYIQQHYGLIALPGNFIQNTYPIVVKISDICIILCGVALIGLLMSYLPARRLSRL